MKYDRVLIFTKKGNLLDYLYTNKGSANVTNPEKAREYYGMERDIQLIACLRWEDFPVSTRKGIVQMSKCFCKIKCPVSPLPVKGEFELASMDALRAFLKADGWKLKENISTRMFE